MKTEYDIVKINEKKRANKRRKFKFIFKRFIKSAIFLVLAVFAYLVSFKISGFYKTNIRMLTLVVCMGLGFGLFFLINYLASSIAKASYNKKSKESKDNTIVYSQELNLMLNTGKYTFKYDFNQGLSDNLKHSFNLAENLLHDVAKRYDKDGKYYYLNYTVCDALLLVEDVSKGIHNKIDGFFKALKLQDVPLDIVENKLLELIETEKKVEQTEQKAQTQTGIKKVLTTLKKNVLHVGAKFTTFVFKSKIEETVNDVIKFLGEEAFKIYGQRKVVEPASVKEARL